MPDYRHPRTSDALADARDLAMATPESPAAAPYQRAPWLILLGLLSVAIFGLRTISNSDFWVHLAAGRHILGHGIPRTDPFSFATTPDQPWVNPSWLYEIVLYLLWRMGGAALVIVAHVAAVAGGFALLLPVARRLGADVGIALALVVAAWVIAPSFAVGPTALTLLFAGVFLRVLDAGAVRLPARVLLCALQVAWANVHGSFLLGPLLALLYAGDAWVAHRRQPAASGDHARTAQSAAWLAALLFALTLVNPFLLKLHLHALHAATNANAGVMLEWISPFQSEFAPTAARHASTVALVVIACGFIVVRGRLPLAATSLAVASAFLLVLSPRFFEFSALMALPFMTLSLQAVGRALHERLAPHAAWPTALARAVTVLAAVATLGAVASGCYFNRTGSASAFGLGAAEDLFPGRACEQVIGRPDFPERALNLAVDGGYLAWKLPQRKVFADTRGSLYGVAFYQDLGRALLGQAQSWSNVVAHWNPQAVILNCAWPGAGAAARHLVEQPAWALVYFDGTTAVLVQRLSGLSRLIADYEVQAEGLIALEAARRQYAGQVAHRSAPRNPPQLIGAGAASFALWRFREAEAIYTLLTLGAPTMTTAWLNLGICQYHRRAYAEAARTLETASRLRPGSVLAWLWLSKSYGALGETEPAEAAMQRARTINAAIADSFEAGFQADTNTTLPGVSMDSPGARF